MEANSNMRSRRWLHPRSLAFLLLVTFVATLIFQWWDNPSRYVSMGMEALRTGDEQQLEKAAEQLEGAEKYQSYREFFLGSMALGEGNPTVALRHFGESMEHPDLEVDARVLAGQAAYEMGAAGNAKLYWEDALKLDPLKVSAHRWLGAMYYDLGAMDNALLHLQAVSMLDPMDPRPTRLVGLINHDYERAHLAIPAYQETLRRDPNQPDAAQVWLELAECQLKQREFTAALESLEKAADSPKKDRLLAEGLMNLGELEEAKSLAAKSLAEAPEDVECLKLSAQIALLDGDVEKAVSLLENGAKIDAYNHSVQTQLAQLYGRMGDAEASQKATERAEELQQKWLRFSDLQVDAIAQMTNADIRYQIGSLALELGKPELAASWFRAALAINPSMASAAEALRRIEEGGGSLK